MHYCFNGIVLASNQGINRERVEQMEDRLKEDILMEAERYFCHGALCLSLACHMEFLVVFNLYYQIYFCRYGNKILVTDELPDGQMVDQWEPVSCNSVKTPLEV